MDIRLERTTSADPGFRALVRQLDTELRMMYNDMMDIYDHFNIIEQNDTVVIAYLNDAPVGCGCFKKFDTEAAEVKRMFVIPEARGKGISTIILNGLETWALELGYPYTILETGFKNIAALNLYKNAGYTSIPNYEPYINLPGSICFRKTL